MLGYHRLTTAFGSPAPVDENPSRLGRSARLDRPLRAGRSPLYNAVRPLTQPGDGILIQTPTTTTLTGATVNTGRRCWKTPAGRREGPLYRGFRRTSVRRPSRPSCSSSAPPESYRPRLTEEEPRRMGEICNEYGVMVVGRRDPPRSDPARYKHIVPFPPWAKSLPTTA